MATRTLDQQAEGALRLLESRLKSLGIKPSPRRSTEQPMTLTDAMAGFDDAIAGLDAWFDMMVRIRDAVTEAVNSMRAVMEDAMNQTAKKK